MSSLDRIEAQERAEALKSHLSHLSPTTPVQPYDPSKWGAEVANTCEPTSFRSVAKEHIWRLRNEAERLEALLNALPITLPAQADRALIELLGG